MWRETRSFGGGTCLRSLGASPGRSLVVAEVRNSPHYCQPREIIKRGRETAMRRQHSRDGVGETQIGGSFGVLAHQIAALVPPHFLDLLASFAREAHGICGTHAAEESATCSTLTKIKSACCGGVVAWWRGPWLTVNAFATLIIPTWAGSPAPLAWQRCLRRKSIQKKTNTM